MFFNASSQQNFIEGQNNSHAETYDWPPPGRRRRHPAGEISSDDSNVQLFLSLGSRFMSSITLSPNSTSSSFPSSPASELESLESDVNSWPLPGQSYNPFNSNYDPIYQHQSNQNSMGAGTPDSSLLSGGRFMRSANSLNGTNSTDGNNNIDTSFTNNNNNNLMDLDENNNATPRNYMTNYYDINNNDLSSQNNLVDMNNNLSGDLDATATNNNDDNNNDNNDRSRGGVNLLPPSSRFNTGLS